MLFRVIGWLLLVEAGIMVLPTICGLVYKEGNTVNFLISMIITAIAGFCLMSLRPSSRDMGKREAILLTGLTWVILSLFGMIPFMLCNTRLDITDAFFETMSGFITTGATVLDSLEGVPHSLLLWRCIVQWIGGLGIILFTLAIVPMLNYQGGMQLFNAEVTGITHDKLRPRISYTAKGLWMVYAVLTLLAIILLVVSKMNLFDAICYGLSTMSTGGFSSRDLTLEEWDSLYIKIIFTVFMFLGGVNFTLLYRGVHGNLRAVWKNEILRIYIGTVLAFYLILTVNVTVRGLATDIDDVTIDPLFQAVSILSSTGLTEPDYYDWGPIAYIVLIVMMIMGACAGSTSGGAKLDRFVVLYKFLKNEFYRMMHPNAIRTVSINGKGTSSAILQKTLAFLFLYIVVILCGGVALIMIGLPIGDSFFCTLSAVSNTGLGTDITGIQGNYALVPDMAKWVLCFLMLTGRLELFTVLLIFTPSFWKK